MHSRLWLAVSIGAVAASAANIAPRQTAAPTTTAAQEEVTAITSCHLHGSDLFCFHGDDEYHVQTTPTSDNYPAEYTGCHNHGSDLYCIDPDGEEVAAISESGESEEGHDHEEEGHDHEEGEEESSGSDSSNQHCHFHAGVEHCVGAGESEGSARSCDATPRDYNVGLRVGLLFAILATSSLGVFGPIVIHRFMPAKLNLIFVLLKQFGTGIIISTAFIHLYTHASLMFTNECIGDLGYEGTTSAVVMAGIFLSFVVEYIGQRIVSNKIRSEAALTRKERSQALLSSEVVNILVMEAGIIFHSLLIGLTLVVSGDSFFITLFIVILFHQVFEGMALGTRIATIGNHAHSLEHAHSGGSHGSSPDDADKTIQQSAVGADDSTSTDSAISTGLSMRKKLGLAALFAFVTPIGMAIGIGVLKHFNGNDKSTLVAIGTLDALSAGILVWVGVVEMWAGDWMTGSHGHKAELADADLLTVAIAGFGLVSGLVVMSVLGIWA